MFIAHPPGVRTVESPPFQGGFAGLFKGSSTGTGGHAGCALAVLGCIVSNALQQSSAMAANAASLVEIFLFLIGRFCECVVKQFPAG